MTRRSRAPLAALALLATSALALAAASAGGQTPPPTGETLMVHPEAKAAIDRLKSPFCPGEMLAVCPSSGGAMLRDSIQRMAEAGLSADSIVSVVLREYGDEWRAEPLRSGTGLWAWALPPAAFVLGFGVVAVVLARRRRAPAAIAPEAPPTDPEAEARLRAAMKEVDEAEEPVF
jgi:cytochrome c-type biogenesis protein CcmH/NrfF